MHNLTSYFIYSRIKIFSCFLIILSVTYKADAQVSTFNGWLFSNHKQELSKKWSLLSDIQLRSSDHLKYLQTILIRPALQYKFSEQQSTALGYVYFGNWMKEGSKKNFELEHRVWEQYLLETKIGNKEITNRLRLEQRFLQQAEGFDFAQRLRYYLRFQIPFSNQKEFKKGMFSAVQNEVFLNIQNKEAVNNRFFDQNRAFASIGYRFSEAVDIEAGYLYRYQIEEEKMRNHILQVIFSTKL